MSEEITKSDPKINSLSTNLRISSQSTDLRISASGKAGAPARAHTEDYSVQLEEQQDRRGHGKITGDLADVAWISRSQADK